MRRVIFILIFSLISFVCGSAEYCTEETEVQQQAMLQDAEEKEMQDAAQNIGIIIIVLLLTTLATIIHISLERKRINRVLKQIDKERQEFYDDMTRHFHAPLTTVLDMSRQLSRFIPETDRTAQQEFETLTIKSQELLELVSAMAEYNKATRKETGYAERSGNVSADVITSDETSNEEKYNSEIESYIKIDSKQLPLETDSRNHNFIQRVNRFIHENITDSEVNAAMLAEHMHTSIGTLNRKMNSITGMSTTNYIRLRKLQYAKYLLKHSEMSMSEIQATCGFESPSYFSRAFKAEFNITPTEYRNS
jgi:AraC-like DNA-binding protein